MPGAVQGRFRWLCRCRGGSGGFGGTGAGAGPVRGAMPSAVLMLSLAALLGALGAGGTELTLELPDSAQRCFHQELESGIKFTLDYQVLPCLHLPAALHGPACTPCPTLPRPCLPAPRSCPIPVPLPVSCPCPCACQCLLALECAIASARATCPCLCPRCAHCPVPCRAPGRAAAPSSHAQPCSLRAAPGAVPSPMPSSVHLRARSGMCPQRPWEPLACVMRAIPVSRPPT